MCRALLLSRLALSLLLLLLLVSPPIRISEAHEGHDEGEEQGGGCEMSPDVRVVAEYRPGVVTVDGHGDEWADIDAFEFALLPALDFDKDKAYADGKIAMKALHDGRNVYFLLQVDGQYMYTKGDSSSCPSVALMFQIGENATYSNMGGCRKFGAECSSLSCQGHEVDIMHFSIGNAVPGRLYGSNPIDNQEGTGADRFGHLVDLYSWNPHCRYVDGKGPSGPLGNESSAQNDWQGAWWHSAFTVHSGFVENNSPYASAGQKGTYYFEFSRPLRTRDRLQQDVQFTIGQVSKVAVAFWYPDGGKPWAKSAHYSASCDWMPMNIISASSSYGASRSRGAWDAASAFSLILSGVALGLSVFVVYWVSKVKSVPFTPIDRL
ncbi:hypothetical protein Taro_038730 [Colocasia esculenta]|uniref:Cytochrome c-552/DMSO reductase-like haem-binding domain-containing protein n=1 Tax=Colocasia esculenta TaxID=4460 RepID=A0A843W4A7_COLES|nr:hypothetical protein [Colocasia esculenta]